MQLWLVSDLLQLAELVLQLEDPDDIRSVIERPEAEEITLQEAIAVLRLTADDIQRT